MGAPHGNKNAAGHHKSGVSRGAKKFLRSFVPKSVRRQNKRFRSKAYRDFILKYKD